MANDENGDRIGNDAISDVNPGMYGDVTDDTKRRNQILSFKVYLYGRGNYCTAKRGLRREGLRWDCKRRDIKIIQKWV